MGITEQIAARKRRSIVELIADNRLDEARAVCRSLLAHDSGDAEIWLQLGIVECRAGNFDTAHNCMRKAVDTDPGRAEAWFGFGQVLEKQDRPEQAIKAYNKAIETDPDIAEAHAALGLVYLTLPFYRRAIDHLHRALEIGNLRVELMAAYKMTLPKLTEAYGEALRNGGKGDEAMAVFQSLLENQPDNPNLLQRIANLHAECSRLGEARRFLEKALNLAPNDIELKLFEIRLLRLEKRNEEARKQARALFESEPENLNVALNYAGVCHVADDCDAATDRLETLARSGSLDTQQEIPACFELGRLHDTAGRYDRAFEWYRRANELITESYDAEKTTEEIDAIMESYSREHLAIASRADNEDRRPVFIVGMPRSGTSLVEQILASHPEVYGGGELTDIGSLYSAYREERSATDIESIRKECRNFTTEDLSDMANQYLDRIGVLSGKERYITDKMPNNCLRLGPISLMLPHARIIHCRRNPVDTCLSCYFQNFKGYLPYTNSLESLVAYYRDYRRLMRHWKTVVELPILEVDYEALVEDQETQTRRMLEFLGLEWDERCLQQHRSDRVTNTASRYQVNRPVYRTSVARWKHYRKHIGPLLVLLDEEADVDL